MLLFIDSGIGFKKKPKRRYKLMQGCEVCLSKRWTHLMEVLTEQIVHDPTGLKNLERQFGGKHAQVYCTNGARLTGIVNFMPNKWIAVIKDDQHSALVNLDFVISIALETA